MDGMRMVQLSSNARVRIGETEKSALTQTIKGALAAAGLNAQSGVARSVTQTIEQALANAA